MTKKDTLEIVLKVFGLYLLTVAFESLIGVLKSSTFFFTPNSADTNENLIYFIANSFRTVFYSFGFWVLTIKTNLLNDKLIKDNPDSKSVFNIEKNDLLQTLFTASGIIILIFSISEIWNALTMVNYWNEYNAIREKYRLSLHLMEIGVPTTKGLIGLTLIFFSNRLARLLTRRKK